MLFDSSLNTLGRAVFWGGLCYTLGRAVLFDWGGLCYTLGRAVLFD